MGTETEETTLLSVERSKRNELLAAVQSQNEVSARFGLTLSPAAAERLLKKRAEALMDTGRVELSRSALPALIDAFCDSPYLMQEEYEETLAELLDAFYSLKNESRDQLSDDELLQGMRAAFDASGGSTDAVIGMQMERLLGVRSLAEERGDDEERENDE